MVQRQRFSPKFFDVNRPKIFISLATTLLAIAVSTLPLSPTLGQTAVGTRQTDHNYGNEPAKVWQDALISGNGVMGIMVHGDPPQESIVFNHELLYEFIGTETVEPADVSSFMPKAKAMLKEGKYYQTQMMLLEEAKAKGHPDILWTDPYHPACRMKIEQHFEGDSKNYRRSTGYTDGQIGVQWSANDVDYKRQSFVSRVDNVIAMQISASKASAISIDVHLVGQKNRSDFRPRNITKNIAKLLPQHADDFKGYLIEPVEIATEDQFQTLRVKYKLNSRGYEVVVMVRKKGGTISTLNGVISVKDADAVEILSEVRPVDHFEDSEIIAIKQRLSKLGSYDQLLNAHSQVHAEMYGRVSLELDKTGFRDGSNEALIAEQKTLDRVNPYLLEKVFNMGIYGLISSSGDNPPNLMGIWNGKWRPNWSGDFTLDANLNLQIAAASIANQKEAVDSYMKLLERIAPDWEVNARNLFGCRGYLAGTRTSGRRNFHTHFGKWPGNHWTAGAGWLLSPCYEYYLCSGDEKFLLNRLMPMMKKTALFYEDFLDTYDDDGNFLIVPSYSPENKPSNLDPKTGVSANAAMDIAVIRELMTNLITSSNKFKINQDKIETWEAILSKLPPYLINDDGALKEWAHHGLEDRYDHRHVSHLYLAWPSLELTPDNERLFTAAKMAMNKRGRGNGSAHGLAHSALIATRLKQPELVYGNLHFLMTENYLYKSLFTSHNPGAIYNSDALHSIPAVVLEMLVYSRPGVVEFLPACSEKFPSGTVRGVMCRTQARVDEMTWNFPERRVHVTMTSGKDQTLKVGLRQPIKALTLDGQQIPFNGNQSSSVAFKSGESKSLILQW